MIIDCKSIANTMKKNAADELQSRRVKQLNLPLFERFKRTKLLIIKTSDDPASNAYIRGKIKDCIEIGLIYEVCEPLRTHPNLTSADLIDIIARYSKTDISLGGIIVQLPLAKQFEADRDAILNAVPPHLDVDGITNFSKSRLPLAHQGLGNFIPCTAYGVLQIFDELSKKYNYTVDGKHVAIIGRSDIVGKPLAILLNDMNATVTLCHSHTKNLKEICLTADIIISAVGKPGLITADMVKKDAVAIDVGITRTSNGLKGDFDFEQVSQKCKFITTVPGGVGLLTRAALLHNVVMDAPSASI